MSTAAIAHLGANEISQAEFARVQQFIEENHDSAVGVFLQRVLSAHADGVDVDVFADDAELTPNQAAEFLKMSRPHLLSFIENGDLSFHWVGTHRRIKMSDLHEFMSAREAGAEVLANALHESSKTPRGASPLEQEELNELKEL